MDIESQHQIVLRECLKAQLGSPENSRTLCKICLVFHWYCNHQIFRLLWKGGEPVSTPEFSLMIPAHHPSNRSFRRGQHPLHPRRILVQRTTLPLLKIPRRQTSPRSKESHHRRMLQLRSRHRSRSTRKWIRRNHDSTIHDSCPQLRDESHAHVCSLWRRLASD